MSQAIARIVGPIATEISRFRGAQFAIGVAAAAPGGIAIGQLRTKFQEGNFPVRYIASTAHPVGLLIVVNSLDPSATPDIAVALQEGLAEQGIKAELHLATPGAESVLRHFEKYEPSVIHFFRLPIECDLQGKQGGGREMWENPIREYRIQANEIEEALGLFQEGWTRRDPPRQTTFGPARTPDMIGLGPLTTEAVDRVQLLLISNS
jgi:hypothetical protein